MSNVYNVKIIIHIILHPNNKNKPCFQHNSTIGIPLPKNRYKPSKQRWVSIPNRICNLVNK